MSTTKSNLTIVLRDGNIVAARLEVVVMRVPEDVGVCDAKA